VFSSQTGIIKKGNALKVRGADKQQNQLAPQGHVVRTNKTTNQFDSKTILLLNTVISEKSFRR